MIVKCFIQSSHNDSWDNLNAMLSESTSANTRAAGLMRKMLASRAHDDYVEVAQKGATADKVEAEAEKAKVVVMGSGCTGLIYFTDSPQRMTFEQIQTAYPELMLEFKRPSRDWVRAGKVRIAGRSRDWERWNSLPGG